MGLVATWLNGCGLSHAIPNFTAAGIVTPAALAELDLAHYEALGISSPEERRKMFYLVQRVKLAVEKERKESTNSQAATAASLEEQVDALIQSTSLAAQKKPAIASPNKENDCSVGKNAVEQSHGEPTRQEREMEKKVAVTASRKAHPTKAIAPVKKKSSPSKIPVPSPKRASPSKLAQPKSLFSSNNNQRSTTMTTAPGETTTPTKSPRTPNTKLFNDANDDNKDDGSSCSWEDIDGEEDECADDEASSMAIQSSTRRSKRLAEKTKPGASTTAASIVKPSTKKIGTTTTTTTGTAGYKTPQPKSSLPRPTASRRQESKLQNPSKSMRTGKQLSTIPSDSIAVMSPLTKMPPPQLNAEETTKEKPRYGVGAAKDGISGRKIKAKSRRSISGSVSDSSDSESVGGSSRSRSRRTSLQAKHLGRKSSGSFSDSESSTSQSSRRRSMGRLQAPKARGSQLKEKVTDSVTNQTTTKRAPASQMSPPNPKNASTKKAMIHGNGKGEEASWKGQIDALRQEVALEHELFSEDVFHDDDDADDTIRVIVRKRPFTQDKPSAIDVIQPLEFGSYGKMLVFQPTTRVDLTKEITKVPFAYDGVFGEGNSNAEIYDKAVRNLIPVVLDGQHSTVFAFGCTGSGKTHTMMGSNFTGKKVVEEENMGLYYMAAMDVFRYLEESEYSHLSVGVSLFEIYGGKLFDLLNDRKMVKCLEDHKGKVQFPGLSEHNIDGPGELIELIELGAMSRSTGTTSRNADSSRSHAVLQLHLRKTVGRKQNVEHGRLTFIDLAGSERGADTANYSRATRLEGAEINTSLLALKEVIRARARGGSMNHVPFRGSKLTQVLKESFVGENSRCLMIACIAPDMESCEQTLNTLRYADRVKERNAETGALPSKFKRGGRRRSSMMKPSASLSSIVSSSDQSVPRYKANKKTTSGKVRRARETTDEGSFEEESESDYRTSNKESGPEIVRTASADRPVITDTIKATVSEDTDALLDAVLSDENCLVSDTEASNTNSLVGELVETHESFLSTILGMINDEINLVIALKEDFEDSAEMYQHSQNLDSMLQNQGSLISDLRECFQTYESIQATELGEQLQTHRTVLTKLLEIVQDEQLLASVISSDSIEVIAQIEALQDDKISQISELQACFSTGTEENDRAAEAVESKGPDVLLAETFIAGSDDELSVGSFDDLRVL